jgi:hypothetical protein
MMMSDTGGEPSRRPTPSLDRLREHVRARVAATNLPRVARAVGMSPKALERFLAGGTLRGRTRSKMFHWVNQIESEADAEATMCAQMIQSLVAHMPADAQIVAATGIIEVLVQTHTRMNELGVPLWLQRLAEVPAMFDALPP